MSFLYIVRTPDAQIHIASDRPSLDNLLDSLLAQFGDDALIGLRAELLNERSE